MKRRIYIRAQTAIDFIRSLKDKSVRLASLDPPFYGIVKDSWDNQWANVGEYVEFMLTIAREWHPKLTDDGSIVQFAGFGKQGLHPMFNVIRGMEALYCFRDVITWKKRRGYGKSHGYLYCREEILWFSKSHKRTQVVFNKPYTNVKRGYPGFDPRYPALSEYKRVSNVWDDIPELMKPDRTAQKPVPLLERIIATHSNERDLVADCFAGWGTSGLAAIKLNRRYKGCEAIERDAKAANMRCNGTAIAYGRITL